MQYAILMSLLSAALLLPACSARTKHQETTLAGVDGSSAKNPERVVGVWMSDQDGATLTISDAGLFALERGAVRTIGTWKLDAVDGGSRLSLANVHLSSICPDQEGIYLVEVVRDTMRLAIVRDECTGREELMSWPWTRKSVEANLDANLDHASP